MMMRRFLVLCNKGVACAAKQLLWGSALSLQRASYSLTLPLAGHGGRRPKRHARLTRGGNALPRKSKWSPDGTIEGVLRVDGLTIDSTVLQLCEAFCIDLSPSAIQSAPQHKLLLRYRHKPISFIFTGMTKEHRKQFANVFGSSEVYIKLEAMSVLRTAGMVTLSDWSNLSELSRDSIVKRVEEHSMVRNLLDKAARDAGLSLETGLVRKAETTLLYDAIVSATCNSYSVAMDEDPQGYIVAYGDPMKWARKRDTVTKKVSTYGVSNAGPVPVGSKWRDKKHEALRVLSISPGHGVGWPVEWTETKLYVRKETLVARDILFSTEHMDGKDVAMLLHEHSIIIGTPGIGKSFMSGFFLHKLLTEDVIIPVKFLCEKSERRQQHTKLRYILYSIGDSYTIYDKVSKRATSYEGYSEAAFFCNRHYKEAILLFDCAMHVPAPTVGAIPSMVFSSPHGDQYSDHRKPQSTCTHVVNPWTEEELCAWSHLEGLKWPVIKKRAEFVGNVPRLLTKYHYARRLGDMDGTVDGLPLRHCFFYDPINADGLHPSHNINVMLRSEQMGRSYRSKCASRRIERQLHARISALPPWERIKWCWDVLASGYQTNEYSWVVAFVEACSTAPSFLLKVIEESAGTASPGDRPFTVRRKRVPLRGHVGSLKEGVFYVPEDGQFPVIDAFILTRNVLVCFQALGSGKSPTSYAELDRLKTDHFDKWGNVDSQTVERVFVSVSFHEQRVDPPRTRTAIHDTEVSVAARRRRELDTFWSTFTQRHCRVDFNFIKDVLFFQMD